MLEDTYGKNRYSCGFKNLFLVRFILLRDLCLCGNNLFEAKRLKVHSAVKRILAVFTPVFQYWTTHIEIVNFHKIVWIGGFFALTFNVQSETCSLFQFTSNIHQCEYPLEDFDRLQDVICPFP